MQRAYKDPALQDLCLSGYARVHRCLPSYRKLGGFLRMISSPPASRGWGPQRNPRSGLPESRFPSLECHTLPQGVPRTPHFNFGWLHSHLLQTCLGQETNGEGGWGGAGCLCLLLRSSLPTESQPFSWVYVFSVAVLSIQGSGVWHMFYTMPGIEYLT